MFRLEDVLQLKDAEEVKAIVRRHAGTLVPPLLLAAFLIIFPFFLLFPLFSWGIPGVVIFTLLVLAGASIAFRAFLLWDADVLIVTTLRLVDVDQRGLLSRVVSEVALPTIQDVTWSRKGLWETVLRMGSLTVQTAGSASNIEVIRIPSPDAVHEFINDLRHATTPKRTHLDPEAQEKVRAIVALLERFPLDELGRIETILKERERKAVTDAFLGDGDKDEAGKE